MLKLTINPFTLSLVKINLERGMYGKLEMIDGLESKIYQIF